MLVLSRFNAMMENAYEEKAPHKICAYIYELANAFNGFYHETKILSEEDFKVQASYIGLLVLTKIFLRPVSMCLVFRTGPYVNRMF